MLGYGFKFGFGCGVVLGKVENVDCRRNYLLLVGPFDFGKFLEAFVFGVLETPAFVEVFNVFGFDPGGGRDFSKCPDASIFFAEARQLFDEPLNMANFNSSLLSKFRDVALKISCLPDGEET